MLIGLIVYGVAFGALSAMVAHNKNRDPFGWFLLGLPLGIFAFIAVLVLDSLEPDERAKPDAPFDPDRLTKKCPDCAEKIKLEARVCRFCDRRFDESEVETALASSQQKHNETRKPKYAVTKDGKIRCPECNGPNPTEYRDCEWCGCVLPHTKEPHPLEG